LPALVIALINEGEVALDLRRIVMNRADDGGWTYRMPSGATNVTIVPGGVRVLDVADFVAERETKKFGCRLPVSLEGTGADGRNVLAHGLRSTPSALSSDLRACTRNDS
jgi:hypothetical protein